MYLWKTSLFLILGIASRVSAGKWKEPNFTSTKIRQLIRQGFTLSCLDCSTLQYLLPGNTETTKIPCSDGKVCGPLDGAFSCIEADDPDAAVCSCGDIETGYIQDPYNPMKYYACLPGGELVAQECEDGEFYTGDHTDETTACAATPKCDNTNVGFNKYETSCTQYYFCDDDDGATTTVQTCDAGKVWDNTNVECVDPCTLAPAAFTCDGKEPGAYPDTADCGVFHLCFGGRQFTQQCSDDAPYVNAAGMCVKTEAEADCPTVDICYEEYQDTCSITESPSSTTTTPVTTKETTSTGRTHKTTSTTPSSTTDTTGRSTTSTTPETTQTITDETTTDETTTDETTSTTESSTTTELAEMCDAESGICDCSKVTSATYFPHNETCSKFYSCESDDNGGFEQKEYSCPGDLVFDPVNQYCNLLNLVPSCQNL